jgi:hypothetical protein
MGKSVVIAEWTQHLGGLTTGGAGTDSNHTQFAFWNRRSR